MVVSSVGALPVPPAIRLPMLTSRWLTRPVTGSGDAGEFQVQLGGLDGGFGDFDAGSGDAHFLDAFVIGAGRQHVALAERSGAGELLVGEVEPCVGLGELRLGGGQGRFIRARIDHEEQSALLDDLAVLKMDRLQVAGDARPDFHVIDRTELSGELVPFDQIAAQRVADRDRRWRRCRCLGLGGCRGAGK